MTYHPAASPLLVHNTPTSGGTMTTTAQTAHADQLAADLRDRRCCDAFKPCNSCRVARQAVRIARALALVPVVPAPVVPSQRRPSRPSLFARKA